VKFKLGERLVQWRLTVRVGVRQKATGIKRTSEQRTPFWC